MSANDFRVPGLSDDEVRSFAKKLRTYHRVPKADRADVVSLIKSGEIWTIDGRKPLKLDFLPDIAEGDAVTTYDGSYITISLKRATHQRAFFGMGRDRNTIAHELCHACVHYTLLVAGATLHRSANTRTHGWIKPYESAEHQAKVFAPAYLIDDEAAIELGTVQAVSVRFGISEESADIYLKRLLPSRDRGASAQRVVKAAQDFREMIQPKPAPPIFLDVLCTNCGSRTLFPVGHKYMCNTCNSVSDRFSDGDRA